MNILMVVHQFLPRHVAGSEIYTYRLAQALRERGHRVQLFFTEIRPDRPQYELSRGEFEGIPYFEAVHNRVFASLGQLYRDPQMEQLFERVLDQVTPDIVHVQHLHLHSIGYIDLARRRRLPLLYTLHEYMLMCLNEGLLLRPGPTLCGGPEPEACARCALVAYPDIPVDRDTGIGRLVTRMRKALGFPTLMPSANGNERAYRAAVRVRRRDIETELAKVDLFISPSRFLRQRFIDEGMIAADRIIYSDNGFYVAPFRNLRKSSSPTLRTGFVGTISEYKGVHLIVEAFRGITDAGIECRIYGDPATFPQYTKRLMALGRPAALRYMGSLRNDKVAEVLADLDVLIVPSLWPENSPLTIHEAYLAKLPVLTSDHGGMAELVEHERTGLHFRTGDAADLRRQLLRLRNEPDLLPLLSKHLPAVKTIETDAVQMEERYRLLQQGTRPLS